MTREDRVPIAALILMAILVALAILFGRAPREGALPSGAQFADELSRPISVSPEALAAMLQRREPMTVVDLREPEAYARFRLPGAVNASPAEIVSKAGESILGPPGDQEIVLCSEDNTDAFEAAVELVRKGYRHVHLLEGGIPAFLSQVLTPPSLQGVISEASAKELQPVYESRRRFFLEGGHAAPGLARDPESIAEPTLVSSAWLAKNLSRVVPVDVRSLDEFAAGHIPGAAHLPLSSLRETQEGVPDMLIDAERLVKAIGALGIGPGDEVVVYGSQIRDATLGAMAFLRIGHRKLAVLEASWGDWVAEGREVSKDPSARPAKEYPLVPGADDFTISTAEVAEAVRSGKAIIVDARTPADYRGESGDFAGRAGHIPGAVSRNFALDLVGGSSGTKFQAAAALLAEYAKIGATAEKGVIIYCRTGHRASQSFYLLRHILGFQKVRWYDGAWQAWAAAKELPIEAGEKAR